MRKMPSEVYDDYLINLGSKCSGNSEKDCISCKNDLKINVLTYLCQDCSPNIAIGFWSDGENCRPCDPSCKHPKRSDFFLLEKYIKIQLSKNLLRICFNQSQVRSVRMGHQLAAQSAPFPPTYRQKTGDASQLQLRLSLNHTKN